MTTNLSVADTINKIQETKITLNNAIMKMINNNDRHIKLLVWVASSMRYTEDNVLNLDYKEVNIIFGIHPETPKKRTRIYLDDFIETYVNKLHVFDEIEYDKYEIKFSLNDNFSMLYTNVSQNYMSFKFEKLNINKPSKAYVRLFLFFMERGRLNKRITSSDEIKELLNITPDAPVAYIKSIPFAKAYDDLEKTFSGLRFHYEKKRNNFVSITVKWNRLNRGFSGGSSQIIFKDIENEIMDAIDESGETNTKLFLQKWLKENSKHMKADAFDDTVRELDNHIMERLMGM